MPVYVRRRQAETPDTLAEFSTDDEDFIVDPDQCRDLLPQPFRLVAKLLDAAVDDIWQYIAQREDERETELQRVLPPQYGTGNTPSLHRVNCVCASPDNKVVFVGQSDGISAVRVGQSADCPIDSWQCSDFDITTLSCSCIAEDIYLIAANDDMGVARLFAFAGDRFLLLKIMNDTEGDKKVLATKIDLSSTSEFCALLLENPGTGEIWLEIHKLPKEAWTKELEGVVNSKRQAAAKRAAAQEETATEDGQQTQRSATASPVEEDRTVHKFSSPTLTLRCRPTPKITGNTATTLAAALKGVDTVGDVIGNGSAHPLSAGHLDQRQVVFESLHEHQLHQLPPQEEDLEREFQSANWHFLNNGRSLPHGLELPQNENGSHHTAGIALWWSGRRQLQIYSLLRPAKEVEHRSDQLFPFTSPITASCLTPCSSLLAVGLKSGHVLIHDWHLGIARRILNVCDSPIWRLRFLGSYKWSMRPDYPPYREAVDLTLLVVTEDKTIYKAFSGPGMYGLVEMVTTSDKHQHEKAAWVDAALPLNQVIIRCSHAGVLTLHDVMKEKELCRLVMPENTSVAEPWQPQLCFPTGSSTIYIRGIRKCQISEEGAEVGEAEEDTESMLVSLDLSCIPELISYFENSPSAAESTHATAHPMVTERVNALLELRLKTHGNRSAKLQERWHRLRETFKAIQERRVDTEFSGLNENDEQRSVLNSTPLSDFQWKET